MRRVPSGVTPGPGMALIVGRGVSPGCRIHPTALHRREVVQVLLLAVGLASLVDENPALFAGAIGARLVLPGANR